MASNSNQDDNQHNLSDTNNNNLNESSYHVKKDFLQLE